MYAKRKSHGHMSVPFIGKAMPANSSENVQLLQRNDGPEPATIARHHSLQSTKEKYRLLIKENVFSDLLIVAFEEHTV